MNNFTDNIYSVLAKFKSTPYLTVAIPTATSLILLAILVAGVFSSKIRELNKTPLIGTTLAHYCVVFAKTAFDLSVEFSAETVEYLVCGILLAAPSCLLLSLLSLQTSTKKNTRRSEPNYLDDEPPSSPIPYFFTDATIRNVEKAKTEKMLFTKTTNELQPNYSEILSYVNKIRSSNPEHSEEHLLKEIEFIVERCRNRGISDFERRDLSRKLSSLIRLIAKYEAV